MRQTRKHVSVLDQCELLHLVLVQFSSPFGQDAAELQFQSYRRGARYEWAEEDFIHNRVRRFWSILDKLKSREQSGVGIIVFPEYAIPKEAHQGLQEYVNQTNCIVIPGSYYDNESKSKLRNNNVCTVYLPGQIPVSIVKKHGLTGPIASRSEQAALQVPNRAHNIVHLTGSNPLIGEFSVSVAICRDYLEPFNDDNTSLLDWAHPGLNLVVMCTTQRNLFDYRAAFDMRGLPGERRITALCNASGTGVEGTKSALGSALFGPKEHPELSPGDILVSLDGEEEGLLAADISLKRKLARHEIKPDKSISVPVTRIERYRISAGATQPVELTQIREPQAVERGVWHPAFLEHMKLRIVLHLFVTRHQERVFQAFGKQRFRYVTAFAIEGKYDLLMRYYEHSNEPHSLSTFHIRLTTPEFNQMFSEHKSIEITPENIIKFRTIPVPSQSQEPDDWASRRRNIADLISRVSTKRREQILQISSQLARDWSDSRITEAMRRQVAPLFFNQREMVETISDYETGRSTKRRKFILISVGETDERRLREFETEIVVRDLAPMSEVRTIYRIKRNIDGPQFDFFVDVSAEPWRLAQIILGINMSANRKEFASGTRSMEVLKFLATESVEGVYFTDRSAKIVMLLDDCKSGDEALYTSTPPELFHQSELLEPCSEVLYDHLKIADPLPSSIRAHINCFYVNLFLGNVVGAADARDECFRKASNAWREIFELQEQWYENVARRYLLGSDTGDLWTRASTHLTSLGAPDQLLDKIKKDWVRVVFQLVQRDNKFDFKLPPPSSANEAARNYNEITTLRNHMVHAQRKLIYLRIPATEKDGYTLKEIAEMTSNLINQLLAAHDYLN